MPETPDDLLPIGPASHVAGLSPATLRKYDKDGLIEVFRTPSGQRRFRRGDMQNLLTSNRASVPPDAAAPARVSVPAAGANSLKADQ